MIPPMIRLPRQAASCGPRRLLPLRLAPVLMAAALAGCIVVPISLPRVEGDSTGLAALPLPATCSRAPGADATEARLLDLINAFRSQNGLRPLRTSARLSSVAQGHACDNAARGSIDHTGSDGATLDRRLSRGGYRYWTAAENTGLGFYQSPERMVQFWINSPGHRANLLIPDVREAGLGLTGGSRPAWVLNLATPR